MDIWSNISLFPRIWDYEPAITIIRSAYESGHRPVYVYKEAYHVPTSCSSNEVMVFTSSGHRVIFPREVEFMTNYYNLIPIHLS